MSEVVNLADRRLPTAQARGRIELASYGIDESLQSFAGDPFGGLSAVGLRVPTKPSGLGQANRYLFALAGFTVPEGRRYRLIGFRQLLTIGVLQPGLTPLIPPRVNEIEVESPFFRFYDGNVSWHIRRMAISEPFSPIRPGNTATMSLVTPGPTPVPLRNLAWKTSDTPALLFQSVTTPNFDPFYVDLTAYSAPNKGRPWGRALSSDLTNFVDLKVPWRAPDSWHSLDVPIEGPARIAFYASVKQTDPTPANRPPITPSAADPAGLSLSKEERFILNFPGAIYWRVGGALIARVDDDEE